MVIGGVSIWIIRRFKYTYEVLLTIQVRFIWKSLDLQNHGIWVSGCRYFSPTWWELEQ